MLPGPDFVGVVRSSLTRGTRAGPPTPAGATAGLGFHATPSLAGLAAVMTQNQWLALAVRVAGGGYLIDLGVRLVLARPGPVVIELRDGEGVPRRVTGRSFLFGLGVTLTNRKATVLLASVFAPAVTDQTPAWLMALSVALVMTASAAWCTLGALLVFSPSVIRRFRNAQHRTERAAGACFVAIGARILAGARSPIAA